MAASRFRGTRKNEVAARQPDLGETVNWLVLADKIKEDDPTGREELHRTLSPGIRFFLHRELRPYDLETRVQETFTNLVWAIKTDIVPPNELFVGWVRNVVLKQIATYRAADMRGQVVAQPNAMLEAGRDSGRNRIDPSCVDLMSTVLRNLSSREREALTRFYVHKESQNRICEAMQIGEGEFLLLKNSVKTVMTRSKGATS